MMITVILHPCAVVNKAELNGGHKYAEKLFHTKPKQDPKPSN